MQDRQVDNFSKIQQRLEAAIFKEQIMSRIKIKNKIKLNLHSKLQISNENHNRNNVCQTINKEQVHRFPLQGKPIINN